MDRAAAGGFEKYEIIRELGQGATSIVYLAHDTFNDREVAIKVFKPEVLSDTEHGITYRKLIANEVALAGRLNHPHIVGIYDAMLGREDGYIVMEYVQGETLEKHGQIDNLLPVDKVIEIAFKCALALDFASRNGIIHRDIKPANIMLCSDGVVKIADFGAAIVAKNDETQLTGVGSPSYMSPEQARNDNLNYQTDIYSLGVVLYKLLTGRLPFEAESNYALTHKILNEDPPGIRTHRPALSARLADIVTKAMRRNRPERHANWREFIQDLSTIAELDLPQQADSETQRFNMLNALPFFQDFSEIELWEVLRISIWGRVPAGTILVEEGTQGNFFFVIADGSVGVVKGNKKLATLGKGHCFGEMCYIRRGAMTRTATIVAETPVTLFKIKADSLHKASENCQLRFNRSFMNILVDRLAKATTELAHVY
ncbi:MAG: protein kinase [Sterolibacteriaceae bacterium]|uniref:serine/threonine-protein kinase n=1 Tax=Sulfuritalea sp. TaxID=2480090 RepID=UPI001A40916B|nr:serine/threonine-protein kinase [Sulfuritalea sp.]MBL8480052.1 protein kinase [Sterolibacteriaceae bacterium]MBN8474904.1 protein kinase [Sulfuritalea sp.]